ncbi:MAG: two-component system activity regulator YycH, partial [Enterococcus sp.]
DRDENTLIYRTFVEGFPVFGTNSKGEFSIEINSNAPTNEQVKIETSLNAIQVPIPSDEEVELPSTTDVIDQLTNAGAENDKISSLIVGYTWQNVKETNRVVDLSPTWYIKYDAKWYSLDDLLSKLQEAGAE